MSAVALTMSSKKGAGDEMAEEEKGIPPANAQQPVVEPLPAAQRPLTFQPALDDSDHLNSYLRNIFQLHLEQRQRQLNIMEQSSVVEAATLTQTLRAGIAASHISLSRPQENPSSFAQSVAAGRPANFDESQTTSVVSIAVTEVQPTMDLPGNSLAEGSNEIAAHDARQMTNTSRLGASQASSFSSFATAPPEAPKKRSKDTTAGGSMQRSASDSKPKARSSLSTSVGPQVAANSSPKKSPPKDSIARGSRKRAASDTKPKATPRRARAGNNASLLKAKNINYFAPDPEEQSPPDETPEERRRRKERINGRRKRAKKMIEIDYLNEQYHNLKQENESLQTEQKELKEKIAVVKNLQQSGIVPRGPHAISETGRTFTKNWNEDQANASANASEPKPSPAVDSRVPVPASLLQYVLPPSSLALRPMQTAGSNQQQPQEESKEAAGHQAQPQFLGLDRLGPTGFNAMGNLGITGLPSLMGLRQDAFANQAVLPFAQAQPRAWPPFAQAQPQPQPQHHQQQGLGQLRFTGAPPSAQEQQAPLIFSLVQQHYQQFYSRQQPQQQQQEFHRPPAPPSPQFPNQPGRNRPKDPPT